MISSVTNGIFKSKHIILFIPTKSPMRWGLWSLLYGSKRNFHAMNNIYCYFQKQNEKGLISNMSRIWGLAGRVTTKAKLLVYRDVIFIEIIIYNLPIS